MKLRRRTEKKGFLNCVGFSLFLKGRYTVAVSQSGSKRMFQGRVHWDGDGKGRELVNKLWNAHRLFNGRRDGGGLRDFCRCLMAALNRKLDIPEGVLESQAKGKRMLAAYVRTILVLGAQAGFDPFSKACGEWRSDISLRKGIKTLSSKTQKQIEKAKKKNLCILALQEQFDDCDMAICCLDLFKEKNWYPFSPLKEKHQTVGSYWFRELAKQAIAHVSSYYELCKLEEQKSRSRKLQIQAWSKQSELHALYLSRYRSLFVKAEQQGKIRGHRGRIVGKKLPNLYFEWLCSRKEFLNWNVQDSKEIEFVKLDEEALANIAAANSSEKAAVKISELFRLNPTLKQLDKIHGDFDKLFAIRIKGKLMPDEYNNLPTYTEPEGVFHARGIVFTGPQTSPSSWKNLSLGRSSQSLNIVPNPNYILGRGDNLAALARTIDANRARKKINNNVRRKKLGKVTVKLPTVSGDDSFDQSLSFFPDKRFKRFFDFNEEKGLSALYKDPHTRNIRKAVFQGIRLRFEDVKLDSLGKILSAKIFLDFVVDLEIEKQNDLAKLAKWKKAGSRSLVNLSSLSLPEGIRIGMVNYDVNNIAWVTVGVWNGKEIIRSKEEGFRSRLIKPRADLRKEISRQEAILSKKKRWSGKYARGQKNALDDHRRLSELKDSRLPQGAADILHFLLGEDVLPKRKGGSTRHDRRKIGEPVNIVIISSPDLIKMFGGLYRKENACRASFAAMSLHAQLVRSSQERGLRVIEPERYGYQFLCDSCGELGVRYHIARPSNRGKKLVFSKNGNKFACPKCKKVEIDSRYNASLNLLHACTNPEFLLPYREFRELTVSEQKSKTRADEQLLKPLISKALQRSFS